MNTLHAAMLSAIILLASAAGFAAIIPVQPAPPPPTFTDRERQTELRHRRTSVESQMTDNSILLLLSAEPKIYTNDVDYVFRQENNLYYLTALKQPGAALVVEKSGGKISETIYLPDRDPQNETWNGKKYSPEDAARISGIANVRSASEIDRLLADLKAKKRVNIESIYLLLPADSADADGLREFRVENELSKQLPGYAVVNARPIFAELRHIKSPYELKMLQHAIDITTEAQMRAWLAARNAKMEFEVQAEVEYTFRRRNADYWGYPSIVGSGPNGTTLHYEEAQGPVKSGDLILMDVGAEYEHYSADVTRTFPVSGRYSKTQAEIYQIVYDAQEAAARIAKPGVTMAELSDAADDVIKKGLAKLGLIESPDATIKLMVGGEETEVPEYRIWFMHGLGHWLGMNVHDVGDDDMPFKPGMTYTNEPGIYIRSDALDYLPDTPEAHAFAAKVRPAFEKYKNIGVRIEDDMLITPTGVRWMTGKLPRKMSEIEAFMARNSKLDH